MAFLTRILLFPFPTNALYDTNDELKILILLKADINRQKSM
jgi:hypothetical protein